ncbi:type II toxin-antitoxin system RelE/ParE family toxin [Dyella sp. M7H15-1]|uniref:type II toxin-antitoxin system RelE/ParE family toxin n=1 Tax=Dyella sp. M7H15-1 TaxID=2501295 RepID=UPI001004EA35|nr:type II toxin-antitoxin system RelE/ParE family toxin [Dyella sp. M7H15-1]QAU22769.1 type II toxin-antitoxin system RelE/ParE family toxin [Dyella sp. M7H15-1]
MAEVIWTDPALSKLEEIADYIALENPLAANELVQRVFAHIGQLADHPESGSKPQELKGWRYRQIIEPPCRIFYRIDGDQVFILYVMRSKKRLLSNKLDRRSSATPTRKIGRGAT